MPFPCQKCGKAQATVHLTDIVGGEKLEMHLCGECAEQHGIVVQAQKPGLSHLLHEFMAKKEEAKKLAELTCDHCGMNFLDFRSNGQLGCPNDYEAFRPALAPLIERSHEGSLQHCGKIPKRVSTEVRSKIDLIRLRRQLKLAVDSEEYESAASLRDEIERLEAL